MLGTSCQGAEEVLVSCSSGKVSSSLEQAATGQKGWPNTRGMLGLEFLLLVQTKAPPRETWEEFRCGHNTSNLLEESMCFAATPYPNGAVFS